MACGLKVEGAFVYCCCLRPLISLEGRLKIETKEWW